MTWLFLGYLSSWERVVPRPLVRVNQREVLVCVCEVRVSEGRHTKAVMSASALPPCFLSLSLSLLNEVVETASPGLSIAPLRLDL